VGIAETKLTACVQALIICGWKDRDGIEGFIMLHKRRVAVRGVQEGIESRKKPQRERKGENDGER